MVETVEEAIGAVAIFIVIIILGSCFFVCYKEEQPDHRIHPSDSLISLESCGV